MIWTLWSLALALALVAIPETWALLNFQPLGIDFLPLWTAGKMAWTAPGKVYDFAAVTQAQGWLLPHLRWPRPYAYPPTALLILAPLGRLPFWIALGVWNALGLAVFLLAGARLAKRRRVLVAVLMAVSPPVVLAVLVGQTVLLAAGLATLGIVELKTRPRLAGALLAVGAVLKPQALLLAPVALVACGAWEALASAALVGAALTGLSVWLFGAARWIEWLASLAPFQKVVEAVPRLMLGVITPYGAGYELGLTGLALTLWRLAFALVGIAVVWWVFRRPAEPARRLAALTGGGLLVVPYAMHYDGSLMAAAAVVLAVEAVGDRGWILRLLALIAVSEVTTPVLGAACVCAFLALSLVHIAPNRVAAPARAA